MRKFLVVLIFALIIPSVSFGQNRFGFFDVLKILIQQNNSPNKKTCEDRQRDARSYILNNCPELLKLGNRNISIGYVCGIYGGPIDVATGEAPMALISCTTRKVSLFIDRINEENPMDICLYLAHERAHIAQCFLKRLGFKPQAQSCDLHMGEIEAGYAVYSRCSNRFNCASFGDRLNRYCKGYEEAGCNLASGQYIDFCKNR